MPLLWSFLRHSPTLLTGVTDKFGAAFIYGAGDRRFYVEVLFRAEDEGDPRVRILACRGTEAEVSDRAWIQNQFYTVNATGPGKPYIGAYVPLQILADLLTKIPDASMSAYWG